MPSAARPEKKAPDRTPRWASPDLSPLTRHAWMAGVAGLCTLLYMAHLAWEKKALRNGWGLIGGDGPVDANLSLAFVLLVTSSVMFAVELVIRFRAERGRITAVAPDVREGRWMPFLGECILVYLTELGLLYVAFAFYRSAGEYGFNPATLGTYYKPWFTVMPYLWAIYLYGGLPYVIVTRALQHDPRADRKQAAFVVMKAAQWISAKLSRAEAPRFDAYDSSSIKGLFVKAFFVPLMTLFFVDQFSTLVRNIDFLHGGAKEHFTSRDFHNVTNAVIFSVDVGLAWCGYVVSSRWIKNGIFSAEPTILGWLVALLCYPPFNRIQGYYATTPGEDAYFHVMAGSPNAVWVLAVMSAASYFVYTSATVMFGLRFSNLTHRGIITTGPYALVRHPAYASKNFSWWCVMFPVVLYEVGQRGSVVPLAQVGGMLLMTFIYYKRALTEERHLRKDPEYRAYMKKVPYRFIPGLL